MLQCVVVPNDDVLLEGGICVAGCCRVLQCVAMYCSVLQCVVVPNDDTLRERGVCQRVVSTVE